MPKNRTSRSHFSSFVRYASVCMIASNGANPSVSGTKMKWNNVVVANCHRDSSRAVLATDTAIACLREDSWSEYHRSERMPAISPESDDTRVEPDA